MWNITDENFQNQHEVVPGNWLLFYEYHGAAKGVSEDTYPPNTVHFKGQMYRSIKKNTIEEKRGQMYRSQLHFPGINESARKRESP